MRRHRVALRLKVMPRVLKTGLELLQRTYDEWRADGAPQLAAALTYYLFLSLAPMLVLAASVTGGYLTDSAVLGRVMQQAYDFAGPFGEQVVRELAEAAEPTTLGTVASVVAAGVAVVGAMRVFGQMRIAFDRMWDIPHDEAPDGDVWRQIAWSLNALGRHNLAAFLMIVAVGALLALSLALSSALALGADRLAPILEVGKPAIRTIDGILSAAVVTVLFAVIYRFLPRTSIGWKDVWVGAGVTAALFMLGRVLLELYFAHASPGSAYGAAGSVVALLLWVNFTWQMVLFGAEFTHVWTYARGSRAAV